MERINSCYENSGFTFDDSLPNKFASNKSNEYTKCEHDEKYKRHKIGKRRKSSTSMTVLETISEITKDTTPPDMKQLVSARDCDSLSNEETNKVVSRSFDYLNNIDYCWKDDFKTHADNISEDDSEIVATHIDDDIFEDISLNGATPRNSLRKDDSALRNLETKDIANFGSFCKIILNEPLKHVLNDNGVEEKPQLNESYKIEEYSRPEKWRIIRNLIAISVCAMLMLTALNGIALVESASVPGKNDVLEIATSSTLNASAIISAVLFAAITVRFLGCKSAMILFCLLCIPYAAVQYYTDYYTLLPAAVVAGFSISIFWCTKGTFISLLAHVYSEVADCPLNTTTIRFFCVFHFIFSLYNVWSNWITASELQIVVDSWNKSCGAFCWNEDSRLFHYAVVKGTPYALISCYIALMLISFFIVTFAIDDLNRYNLRKMNYGFKFRTILSTILQLRNNQIWFLVPVAMWFGIKKIFFEESFLQSFIACSMGYSNVPYIIMCYGLTNALTAVAIGLSTLISPAQVMPISIAAILNATVLITLFVWVPQTSHTSVFYLLTVLWSIASATWDIHFNAYCGLTFPEREEEIFSNVYFWQILVYFTLSSFSGEICTTVKLLVVTVLMILSFAAYVFKLLHDV